jgi:hypothetical protein
MPTPDPDVVLAIVRELLDAEARVREIRERFRAVLAGASPAATAKRRRTSTLQKAQSARTAEIRDAITRTLSASAVPMRYTDVIDGARGILGNCSTTAIHGNLGWMVREGVIVAEGLNRNRRYSLARR